MFVLLHVERVTDTVCDCWHIHIRPPHLRTCSSLRLSLHCLHCQVETKEVALERASRALAAKEEDLAGVSASLERRRAELAQVTEEIGGVRAATVNKVRGQHYGMRLISDLPYATTNNLFFALSIARPRSRDEIQRVESG